VETVIGRRFAFGFGEPGVETFVQRLPLILHGEIDDRSRPAEGRRACASLEIV